MAWPRTGRTIKDKGKKVNGGARDDVLTGTPGNDQIDGRRGVDTVDYSSTTMGVTVDLAGGTALGAEIGLDRLVRIENVVGGSGSDTLFGSTGPNELAGGDGNDLLGGSDGNDLLDGGSGLDRATFQMEGAISVQLAEGTVFLADTNDTLRSIEFVRGSTFGDVYDATGFSGSSINAGSNGTFNEFEGLDGNDLIVGNGNTRISFLNATAGVVVTLANGAGVADGDVSVGHDTFTGVRAVRGSEFNDDIRAGAGEQNIDGRAGDDVIAGGPGNDTLNGGDGFDTALFGLAASGVTIDLAAGTVLSQAAGADVALNFEAALGSNFDDALLGTNGPNTLRGNAGNDLLVGRGGDDVINGMAGTDIARFSGLSGDYVITSGQTGMIHSSTLNSWSSTTSTG